MNDKSKIKIVQLLGAEVLVSKVADPDFGAQALRFISETTPIDNFGAFHFSDMSDPNPELSVSSGRMSRYIFRRDADEILADATIQKKIAAQIETATKGSVTIDRWHPNEGDPRYRLYERSGILERVAVSSRSGRGGFRSFYLRSKSRGWLSGEDYQQLCLKLPLVHELIGVRHKIVGTERLRHRARNRISNLKDRNVDGFDQLSKREVECCDYLVEGKSVVGTAIEMGIAETTIKTLRQRAYRKLNVSSAAELMALLIDNRN